MFAQAIPPRATLQRELRPGKTNVDPIVLACIYAVVCVTIVPIVFEIFHTHYRFFDVAAASVLSAAAMLLPSPVGGPASLLVMAGVLYWRTQGDVLTDIVIAVATARLSTIPVALMFHLSPPSFL